MEEARGVAEQAAGVHPHDPAVHLLLGRIALAAGRGADAVEELRRALRLDPLGVAAYRLLGYALVATGRFAEALDQWDQWERLAPRSEAELARLDEWDIALRIAPDHVGALKGLAFLYFKVGDVQQAAAHLEAAQRVAPDDPGIAQALALAHGGEAGPGAASPAPEPMAPAPAAQP